MGGGGPMGAPLVNRPGAQVVGPTGVHASNFNQMVPQGGPPRPTGPGGPGPPPGPPPPAGMGYPGGAVANGMPMPPTMPPPPGVAPPPTMHPQRTANGVGAPGGPSYPTYPGQVPPPGPQGMVPPPGAPHQQPGMIQQNQQGGSNKVGGGGGQRIDPAQIPRPAHDDHAEVIRWDSRTAQGAAVHPPAASTSFIASDRGSCNPRFVHFYSFLFGQLD
jgi:hypothetical protein